MANLSDYIILPRKGESEVLVAKERSCLGLDHGETYVSLLSEGSWMPTIADLVVRLNHLRSGNVVDGNKQGGYPRITYSS